MGMPPSIVNLGERCCGCGVCSAVCSKHAIVMAPDEYGFSRPLVDSYACVGCGACERKCPALSNNGSIAEALAVYWAKSSDEELKERSSSGGVFGELARDTLSKGGLVCGAAWDSDCRVLRHTVVDREADLDSVMRSKYVQSLVDVEVFRNVRNALNDGQRVLYVGTACQVAAMRSFLDSLACSDSFLAVDVICHGVPSPKLWRDWLDYCSSCEGIAIRKVNFRNKATGWMSYSVVYESATDEIDGSGVLASRHVDDWYMKAFLANASLRPSCFDCFAKRTSGSDITLGDFWGFSAVHPEVDCEKGISAVLCNSNKGVEAFEAIKSSLAFGASSIEEVLPGNPSLAQSANPYAHREEFMNDVIVGDIAKMRKKWTFTPSLVQRLKSKLRALKKLYKSNVTN